MARRKPAGSHVSMGPEPHFATCDRCGGTIPKPEIPCPVDAFLAYCKYVEALHAACALMPAKEAPPMNETGLMTQGQVAECRHPHHSRPNVDRCAHWGSACIEHWWTGSGMPQRGATFGHPDIERFGQAVEFDAWETAEDWLSLLAEVGAV